MKPSLLALAMFVLFTTSVAGQTRPPRTAYELRCRGSKTELSFSKKPGGTNSAGEQIAILSVFFRKGQGPASQGLEPGQCTWLDRGLSDGEPNQLQLETVENAQLKQALKGSPIDKSPTAAETWPDARTIPEYLTDPNHYFSFFVYNTNLGYLFGDTAQYWKAPTLVVTDVLANKPEILEKLQPKLETPKKPDQPVEVVGPSGNIEIRNSLESSPPNSIELHIRWKKEYGLPADRGSPFDKNARDHCHVFDFSATVLEGEPGTFGYAKDVGRLVVAPGANMTEEDGYYICSMRIDGLPLDRELTVHADITQKDTAWNVGSEAQPPAGSQRAIIIVGGRPVVTLTGNAPRAVVNLEMIYAAIPTPPR